MNYQQTESGNRQDNWKRFPCESCKHWATCKENCELINKLTSVAIAD